MTNVCPGGRLPTVRASAPLFAIYAGLALLVFVQTGNAQQEQNPAPAPTSPSPVQANSDLAVASVKLQGGLRLSKDVGSSVYNDQNEKVGSIDDLISKGGNQIVMAIVSVGGFLGMGNKLVAVPYDQLRLDTDKDQVKVVMPGANKDALKAMPDFTYNG
jgi:hypothetical protein